MADLSHLLSCLPRVGAEKVSILFGNGLSTLPYVQYKKFLDQVGDRLKAAEQHWRFLEENIRKPSLDMYNLSFPGYFYLATLAKENVVNPLITTNWDCVFDRVARLPDFALDYVQNPCCEKWGFSSYDGYKSLCQRHYGVDKYGSTLRFWKIHGDINYVFLSCCGTLMRLNPIMPMNRDGWLHLSCEKTGTVALQHHILEPRVKKTIGFEEEINGAINDLAKEVEHKNVSILLILGFSGWDYEEIVHPIVELSRNPLLKVFYVNPCNWSGDGPKLFNELSKIDQRSIIKEEGNMVLQEIVKHYGLFAKYKYVYNEYFKV